MRASLAFRCAMTWLAAQLDVKLGRLELGGVSVPIILLRLSLRRSGSISIAFEVTTFGYRRGKICNERVIH
jgi:hypothetical protein